MLDLSPRRFGGAVDAAVEKLGDGWLRPGQREDEIVAAVEVEKESDEIPLDEDRDSPCLSVKRQAYHMHNYTSSVLFI